MTETVSEPAPPYAAEQTVHPAADLHVPISRTALNGVGIAAQHFHGGTEHHLGRTPDGEHRLIVTHQSQQGSLTHEAVGSGDEAEAALHDSLQQMRSLETVRTRALAHVQMTETAGVDFTSLAHYSPRVAPSQDTYPVPDYLDDLLRNELQHGMTYTNTLERPGWQQEVRSLLDTYLAADPAGQQLMRDLKISSLDYLTPEQAVKLSAAFVQNVSKYSHADVRSKTLTRADRSTVPELLAEGMDNKDNPDWQGNGVCRNIAANVKGVFEALKATQGELSMLNNTYAVFGTGMNGAGYADRRQNNFNMSFDNQGHAWNTFVTIDKEGAAVATIIDATWALGHDTTTALQHLDRTDVRAAAPLARLFERSEHKTEAFLGFTAYLDRLLTVSQVRRELTYEQRQAMGEYVTTEYLRAASQLSEVPEEHTMPGAVMDIAYRMRGSLDSREIAALFALDKAHGGLERDRLQALIKDFDGRRQVPLPASVSANNLVFQDNDLQELAYAAVGQERVKELSEQSGRFRMRLRQLHPESLPPFDPYTYRADAETLQDLAARGGIHDRDPKVIMRSMKRQLRRLAGDEAIFTAVVVGRSDYDLAYNYTAITAALRQRQAH